MRYILPLLFLTACHSQPSSPVSRAFYHWKTHLQVSTEEIRRLDSLSVTRLFVKFFDVDWDEETRKAIPVARVNFPETLTLKQKIVPVVFITNEVMEKTDSSQISSLAEKINTLLENLAKEKEIVLDNERQIDCDWTLKTSSNYFQLLEQLRSLSFFKNKILSATIRLHQIKFAGATGIPPVDRGLLMAYNMGDLQKPESRNSILDPDVLKQYTAKLKQYPLPLDIGLPVFDWWVWFRNNQYRGLIHAGNLPDSLKKKEQIRFAHPDTLNKYTFESGDWLRYEESRYEDLLQASDWLNRKLKNENRTVIFYHLSPQTLRNYTNHELETIFSRYR